MGDAIAVRGGPLTCLYCNELTVVGRYRQPAAVQCGGRDCKRAYNRERIEDFHRRYREEHGRDYRDRYRQPFECQGCGELVYTRGDPGRRSYCTKECRREDSARAAKAARVAALARQATEQPTSNRTWFAGECGRCGQPFVGLGGDARYCSERCRRLAKRSRMKQRNPERYRMKRRIRRVYEKALERGSQGAFTLGEWGRRLMEYGGRCAYCCDPDALVEIEHVVPLCRGGTNRIANVVPACAPCNRDKGTLTPSEWKVSGRRRVHLVVNWPEGQWGRVLLADPAPHVRAA